MVLFILQQVSMPSKIARRTFREREREVMAVMIAQQDTLINDIKGINEIND